MESGETNSDRLYERFPPLTSYSNKEPCCNSDRRNYLLHSDSLAKSQTLIYSLSHN